MDKVVCNTSPLIALSMIDEFPLLFQLFDEVFVPHCVYQEVIGTVGVLSLAKQKGFIDDIKSRLDRLRECGFRIGRPLFKREDLGELP